jgi:hypothetical protein
MSATAATAQPGPNVCEVAVAGAGAVLVSVVVAGAVVAGAVVTGAVVVVDDVVVVVGCVLVVTSVVVVGGGSARTSAAATINTSPAVMPAITPRSGTGGIIAFKEGSRGDRPESR